MDDDEDGAASRTTGDEKRRAALAVMAGSIAPRDTSWCLPTGGWKEPWREIARLPPVRRLTVYRALAFFVAFGGFLTWAVVPGYGAVAADALLGFLGISVIMRPASLVVFTIARRKRRRS